MDQFVLYSSVMPYWVNYSLQYVQNCDIRFGKKSHARKVHIKVYIVSLRIKHKEE